MAIPSGFDDETRAQYALILGACRDVLQAAPRATEQCSTSEMEVLLIGSLVQLVTAITGVLPGGIEEMFYYLPVEHQRTKYEHIARKAS